MKKTKIVATIGPASETNEILKELSEVGVNIYRLNFSHGTHEDHGNKMDKIRKLNLPGGIMLDTKGPEIRTGEVRDVLKISKGDKVTFTIDKGVYEDTGKVSVNYEKFYDDVSEGTEIVIDSGMIKAKVIKKENNKDIICEVVDGSGEITTKRHINIIEGHVSLPTITENDWKDIEFGLEKKVEFIALSFVRTAKDIEDVREFCKKKGHVPSIISKIESAEALTNLEDIIKASDGIMVARGDLACEVGFAKIPSIQKRIMELCKLHNRPVIVATQMLLTMINNISPTRAEVSDVANAVFEGASAVMTSDETTKGLDPVNVIRTMANIVEETEKFKEQENKIETTDCFLKSVCASASNFDAIVALTKTCDAINCIANDKTVAPIYAFTDNELVNSKLALLYNVNPMKINFESNQEDTITNALKMVKGKNSNIKKCLVIANLGNDKEYPLITIRNV